jgi:hypothetical protein
LLFTEQLNEHSWQKGLLENEKMTRLYQAAILFVAGLALVALVIFGVWVKPQLEKAAQRQEAQLQEARREVDAKRRELQELEAREDAARQEMRRQAEEQGALREESPRELREADARWREAEARRKAQRDAQRRQEAQEEAQRQQAMREAQRQQAMREAQRQEPLREAIKREESRYRAEEQRQLQQEQSRLSPRLDVDEERRRLKAEGERLKREEQAILEEMKEQEYRVEELDREPRDLPKETREKCTVEQRIELGNQGYTEDDVEKVCSYSGDDFWDTLSKGLGTELGGGLTRGLSKAPMQEAQATHVLWNLWAEVQTSTQLPSRPQFQPSTYLKPNSTYLFTLDLSAISYGRALTGVLSMPSGASFQEQLSEWLVGTEKEVSLKVLILPDSAYFQRDAARSVKTLTVNLEKVRKFQKAKYQQVLADPFAMLREEAAQDKDPDFMFGRVLFGIKTGSMEGNASVALSIWVDNEEIGVSRPVDEIALSFCVSASVPDTETCQGVRTSQYGLRGIDSVRIASETTTFPDAALHFVQLASDRPVIGVFKRNDKPDGYKVWTLKKTAKELNTFLSETQLAVAKEARTDEDFLFHGQELYNTLFPADDDLDRQAARAALEAFVREHPPQQTRTLSPSIFVRLLNQGEVLPLGLMAVPTGENSADFLGFNFRIETPLPTQTYQSSSDCLSQWAIVVPPESGGDATLDDARRQAETVIEEKWKPMAEAYTVMKKFGGWLGQREKETEKEITVLVVLSHHAKNKLSLKEGDTITSSSVVRRFKRPVLAILNGCGTAQPGAEEFIKELNAKGVTAVIATSTEVEPDLAGDFFNCLDESLEKHVSEKNITVSQVFHESLFCLRDKSPSQDNAQPYGAKALKYALLGNGSLRLCPPKKEVSP